MAEQFSPGKQIAIGLLGIGLTVGAGMTEIHESQTSNAPAYVASRLETELRRERKELEEYKNSREQNTPQIEARYAKLQNRIKAHKEEYDRLTANPAIASEVRNIGNLEGLMPLFYGCTLLFSTSLFANGMKRKGRC